MTTPAQAYGHPDFVTDVPVQGPTDEGIRAHDCWYVKNVLPARPSCVDCEGQIPMSAQTKGLLGDRVSFGGRGALGFGIGKAGDPDVWASLSTAQQTWIRDTLIKLDGIIRQQTGTSCPTWGPSITAAGGCFQMWFNKNQTGLTKADGSPLVLRTDQVFDQDTLDALRTVAAMDPKDFPTPYPGTTLPGPAPEEKKLSKGVMVGIAAAGATVLGGVVYVATRKKSRRRR